MKEKPTNKELNNDLEFDSFWFSLNKEKDYTINKGKLFIDKNFRQAQFFFNSDKLTSSEVNLSDNNLCRIIFSKKNNSALSLIIDLNNFDNPKGLFVGIYTSIQNGKPMSGTISFLKLFDNIFFKPFPYYDINDKINKVLLPKNKPKDFSSEKNESKIISKLKTALIENEASKQPLPLDQTEKYFDKSNKIEPELISLLDDMYNKLSKKIDELSNNNTEKKSWFDNTKVIGTTLIISLFAGLFGILNDGFSFLDRFKTSNNEEITKHTSSIAFDTQPLELNSELYFKDKIVENKINIYTLGANIVFTDSIVIDSIKILKPEYLQDYNFGLKSSFSIHDSYYEHLIQDSTLKENTLTILFKTNLVGETNSIASLYNEVPEEIAILILELQYFANGIIQKKLIQIPIMFKN